jgi:hypothetical protein
VDFFRSLSHKWVVAERKHGFNGLWQHCTEKDINVWMADHIKKGDPIDVAIYCMIAWRRQFTTAHVTEERLPEHVRAHGNGTAVNHPSHYNSHPAGVECIAIIEHFNFNIGAAMKYLWRHGMKPGDTAAQDLRKAAWHAIREAEKLER